MVLDDDGTPSNFEYKEYSSSSAVICLPGVDRDFTVTHSFLQASVNMNTVK